MRLLINIIPELAFKLGFNGCGDVPSFSFPDKPGRFGHLYHTKYGDKNIVIGTRDIGRGRIGYYLHIFDGLEPMEMDHLSPDQQKAQYESWRCQVMETALPENKTTLHHLKQRLSQIADPVNR